METRVEDSGNAPLSPATASKLPPQWVAAASRLFGSHPMSQTVLDYLHCQALIDRVWSVCSPLSALSRSNLA